MKLGPLISKKYEKKKKNRKREREKQEELGEMCRKRSFDFVVLPYH
jgi:hypothetical protein